MTFAQRLKNAMEEKSVTAYRLSKQINVHQTTISNWLNGRSEPRIDQLEAIAEALDIFPSYFIGYDEKIKNNEMSKEELSEVKEIAWDSYKSHPPVLRDRVIAVFDAMSDRGRLEYAKRGEEMLLVPEYKQEEPDNN